MPTLEISIPGLKPFTQVVCESGKDCSIPWIGEYLQAIYKFGLGIIGVLATIVMMIGGLEWMTSAGDAGKVGDAQKKIGASVSGLVIIMTAFIILNQVNPELVLSKPITLKTIKEIPVEFIVGDSNTPVTDTGTVQGIEISGSCQSVAESYVGKVTYSQTNRGSVSGNTKLYDCSSWANKVRTSCGRSAVTPYTGEIFKPKVAFTSINDLVPGDLVGWPPDSYSRGGHTYVYLGNGKFADCHGKSAPGNAITTNNSIESIQRYVQKNGVAGLYVKK